MDSSSSSSIRQPSRVITLLIGGWLAAARQLDVPCLLVRSHLKLDSFGLELGRLGSIILVAPSGDAAAIGSLRRELVRARANFGLGFDVTHLYPWLGAPEFVALSRARTAAIRTCTDAIASAVEDGLSTSDPVTVTRTPHDLFFLVSTGITFDDPEASICAELSHSIAARCAADGSAAVAGGSFGLDLVGLTDFVNIHDGLHYLRVSGADIPLELVASMGFHIRSAITALSGAS